MNYLAHLHLADQAGGSLLGNLLGDFARGLDTSRLPPEVSAGIRMHRAVDAFTDAHPSVLQAKTLIDSRFRHLKGVMLDIFFDHFLVRHWDAFHRTSSLKDFTARVYREMATNVDLLSPRLQKVRPAMEREDWLGSYGDLDAVDLALSGMSRRLRRKNILGEGGTELRRQYERFEAAFLEFFPEAEKFARAHLDDPSVKPLLKATPLP